ncbi:sulfite exporter TauE/SafE family protein [Magnetococcales bacterium HHB-1]
MEIHNLHALLIGLVSSLHCLGMCGSIVGMLVFSLPSSIREAPSRLVAHVLWMNIGRILSYLLAALVLGSLLPLWPDQHWGYASLHMVGSVALLATGLYLAGLLPAIAVLEKLGRHLWRLLQPLFQRVLPVRSLSTLFFFGVIWGWFPCALVYSTLLWAFSLGDLKKTVTAMLFFGLGTLPGLLLQASFAGKLSHWLRYPRLSRILGFIVIILALWSLFHQQTMMHGTHIN